MESRKAKPKTLDFAAECPSGAGPQRKIPESLAALTTGFGDDQTRAPPVDWLWRGVMLRIVRLAIETIIFSR